tara:strand:+ start:41 stop:1696 length:1656 start_codon:yes stop_codon:yes gene_type:complete
MKYTGGTNVGKQIPMGTKCDGGNAPTDVCNETMKTRGRWKMEQTDIATNAAWVAALGLEPTQTKESTAGRFYDTAKKVSDENISATQSADQRREMPQQESSKHRASLDSEFKVISVDCIPAAGTSEIIHEHFQSYGKNIEFFNNNRVEHYEDPTPVDKKVIYYFALHTNHKAPLLTYKIKLIIIPKAPWSAKTASGGAATRAVFLTLAQTVPTAAVGVESVESVIVPNVYSNGDGASGLRLDITVERLEVRDHLGAASNIVPGNYRPEKLKFEIKQDAAQTPIFNINHKSISMVLEPTWTPLASGGIAKFYSDLDSEVIALEPPSGTADLAIFEGSLKCVNAKGQTCIDKTYANIAQPDGSSSYTHWATHVDNSHLFYNKDIDSHTIGVKPPYMLLNTPSVAVSALYEAWVNTSSQLLIDSPSGSNNRSEAANAFGNFWKRLLANEDKINFFNELSSSTVPADKVASVYTLMKAFKSYLSDQKNVSRGARDDDGKSADGVHAIVVWFVTNATTLTALPQLTALAITTLTLAKDWGGAVIDKKYSTNPDPWQ